MWKSCLIVVTLWLPALALAGTEGFGDSLSLGKFPTGWITGVTGKGEPEWSIEKDSTAPSSPCVLVQSGSGTFPWAVNAKAKVSDGHVEVKFKALAGEEDQAGGVVWRWKDGDHYYVTRANALENNVSLYYVEKGKRITIKYADAPVAPHQWHTLRCEFSGKHIKVLLDGKLHIELEDDHITGEGAVGVWTKADSKTAFDDFSYDGK